MQLLDEQHLLLKYGCVDHAGSRAVDSTGMLAFFVVFDFVDPKVLFDVLLLLLLLLLLMLMVMVMVLSLSSSSSSSARCCRRRHHRCSGGDGGCTIAR